MSGFCRLSIFLYAHKLISRSNNWIFTALTHINGYTRTLGENSILKIPLQTIFPCVLDERMSRKQPFIMAGEWKCQITKRMKILLCIKAKDLRQTMISASDRSRYGFVVCTSRTLSEALISPFISSEKSLPLLIHFTLLMCTKWKQQKKTHLIYVISRNLKAAYIIAFGYIDESNYWKLKSS